MPDLRSVQPRSSPKTDNRTDTWWEQMACADSDPRIFDEPRRAYRGARSGWSMLWTKEPLKLCASCPVRERCLTEYLKRDDGEYHARQVVGGCTPDQIQELRHPHSRVIR